MSKYYLIDLERSIPTGRLFYWKQNRHGYTTKLDEAGLFPEDKASEIVENDFDERTIMISQRIIDKIMKES